MLIIIDTTPFVDGLIVTSAMLYAPIGSLAFAGIIITLVREKKSQLHLLFLLPLCSIFLIAQLQPYYKYLDHRKTEYEDLLSTKYSVRKGYNDFYPVWRSTKNLSPESENKLTSLLNKHMSKEQVISRLQLDEVEPIVWIEVLNPSLFVGSTSEFAFYNIQDEKLSNFISESDILNALLKHGYNRVYFSKKDDVIYSIFINEIKNEKNKVNIIKSNEKLIIE